MLTGVRSYPIGHAHLEEIINDIWTIPGQNMKGPNKGTPDFGVPLSDEARRIVLVASSLSSEWLTEKTWANNDVAEVIIAHKTGTNVERAYNRTDYLEQRRGYMKNWAEFLISS